MYILFPFCLPDPTTKCNTKKVRINVSTLSKQEIGKLRQKLIESINDKRFVDMGNIHGFPQNSICPFRYEGWCCPHGEPEDEGSIFQLLTWHRLFMVNMEDMLGEALPYWDWTEDNKIPELWEDIKVPFKKGAESRTPLCPPGNINFVRRAPHVILPLADLKQMVSLAFEQTEFFAFLEEIINPHNLVHTIAGCDMGDPATSAYDPIFYLHHANVDR